MKVHAETNQQFLKLIKILLNNVYIHSEAEGFMLVNVLGEIISSNTTFNTATGYSEDEIIQLSAPDFFPGDIKTFIKKVKEAKSGKLTWENQDILCKSGEILKVDITTVYLQEGAGLFSCYFHFHDKQIIEPLKTEKTNKELIENLLDSISTVLFITNSEFNTSYVSPSIVNLIGFSQTEFSQPGFWQSLIHPEDIATINTLLKYSPETPEYQISFRIQNSQGEYIQMINSGRLDFLPNGRICGAVGTLESIRNFNPFINEDGSSLFYLEQLMDNLNLIFYAVSRQGILLAKNKAFEKNIALTGLPPLKVGQPIDSQYWDDPNALNTYLKFFNKCMQGETIKEIIDLKGKQVHLSMTPLRNKNEIEGVAILQQDRTREMAISDELAKAASALSGIINSTSELIWSIDLDYNLTYFNKGFIKFHELFFGTKPEIGGRSKTIESNTSAFIKISEHYAKGLEGLKLKDEIVLNDEIAEIQFNPILDDFNDVIGLAMYARDITAFRKNELQLIESERKYKELVGNVNDIIFRTDANGDWTFLNKSWERVMGFTVQESLGKSLYKYLHPEDIQRNINLFNELINRNKKYCEHEIRYICKDGSIRFIHVYAVLILNEAGEIVGTSGTLQDVTEKRQSKEMYQLLSENVRDMIAIHNMDCTISFITPSCYSVIGYESSELIGKNPFDQIHAEDRPIYEKIKDVHLEFKNTDAQLFTYRFRCKTGDYVWLETSFKIIRDLNGTSVSFIASSRNVDQRKQLEESLIESLQKEKELNELKSRFVSMASHEFRTPMATIRTSTEILEIRQRTIGDARMNEPYIKHLHIINSEIDRLTSLMNDVLLLGKIEANKVHFTPVSTNIHVLTEQIVVRQEKKQFDHRKIHVEYIGKSRPVMLDPLQFNHVLDNLLSNAYKYSENELPPELTITFKPKTIVFEIRDYGIGIPADERVQVFESFFRARNADNIQGTGLGLVIVKDFVQKHGGNVTFHEAEGRGTIFRVEIPG